MYTYYYRYRYSFSYIYTSFYLDTSYKQVQKQSKSHYSDKLRQWLQFDRGNVKLINVKAFQIPFPHRSSAQLESMHIKSSFIKTYIHFFSSLVFSNCSNTLNCSFHISSEMCFLKIHH